MFVLLSPAKRLHDPPAAAELPATEPAMLDQSAALVKTARRLSPKQLRALMEISEPLAELNHARFQAWEAPFTPAVARQAILSFAGDVYVGLDAGSLTADDLGWAQDHVGILSGLYGLLRPLDLMRPYRLEMGAKLKNRRGDDLYAWWGDRITQAIAKHPAARDVVVNLASNEYFSSVDPKRLPGVVITPVFQDLKDGKARTISFFAKQARGAMTRWIIQNRVDDPLALTRCDAMDYRYDEAASDRGRWVFRREQPPGAASA